MAKITESGKIIGFSYSDKALEEAIQDYKTDVESGEYRNPCPPQLFTVLNVNKDLVQTVISRGAEPGSSWFKRAEILKAVLEWLRAEMSTELHWDEGKTQKTMFLLRQDWGDGVTLDEKPDPKKKVDGKRFYISAGGNDPRAKNIWG